MSFEFTLSALRRLLFATALFGGIIRLVCICLKPDTHDSTDSWERGHLGRFRSRRDACAPRLIHKNSYGNALGPGRSGGAAAPRRGARGLRRGHAREGGAKSAFKFPIRSSAVIPLSNFPQQSCAFENSCT